MNSQSSASERSSLSFEQLDPRIQRWIWASGWKELREAQERSIPPILAGNTDVIIAASTASGKTEAAFLPILTKLAQEPGLAIYIGPLKALINDQWIRLEQLCEELQVPVTPWHGDVSATPKKRFFGKPEGCLLITPESLEALLMRHGNALGAVFAKLRYVVIDELHAFIGTERGKQMQSLLCRIETVTGKTVPRIGLSATLGDMRGAQEFLRLGHGDKVELIVSSEAGQDLKVLIKGVCTPEPPPSEDDDDEEEAESNANSMIQVAAELFRILRGKNHLVFPNSRKAVEFLSDQLRRMSEEAGVPNEFWPHHGSLSKEMREQTESALKQNIVPTTAICTSTLELGIDIGSVTSVVQIGPPPSVASLRQRLGRSGRRKGEDAILRGYSIERPLTAKSALSDRLREDLAQSVAMVNLLGNRWYEPAEDRSLHGSTLIQQTLALLQQCSGLSAQKLWNMLCVKGAFRNVTSSQFASLLRGLAAKELIFQDATGLILLAPKGEKLAGHYSFYASFTSSQEFRIEAAGKLLGSVPVSQPLAPGSTIVFGGRRWQVESISEEKLLITVQPSKSGAPPSFGGNHGARVHARVREEMRRVLGGKEPVTFLDKTGRDLLGEARATYAALKLGERNIISSGNSVQLLFWQGDRVHTTIALMLKHRELSCESYGLYIEVSDSNEDTVIRTLRDLCRNPPSEMDIARKVQNKGGEKWDHLLPEELLNEDFAAKTIDLKGALEVLRAGNGIGNVGGDSAS